MHRLTRLAITVCIVTLVLGAGVVAIADGAAAVGDRTDGTDLQAASDADRAYQRASSTVTEATLDVAVTPDRLDVPNEARAVGQAVDDDFGPVSPPGLVVLFGYARHVGSDSLENETRATTYELIQQSPGTYTSKLTERLDVSRSTVRYHLRVLEDEELITSEKIRGKRRYFPTAADETDEQSVDAMWNDDAAVAVVEALERTEPATVSELVTELDRAPATVSYHLSRLEEDGVVERERHGRTVENRLVKPMSDRMDGASDD